MTTIGELTLGLRLDDTQARATLERYRTNAQTINLKLNVEGAQQGKSALGGLEFQILGLTSSIGELSKVMTTLGEKAQQTGKQAKAGLSGIDFSVAEAARSVRTLATEFQSGNIKAGEFNAGIKSAKAQLLLLREENSLGTKELQTISATLNTVAKAYGEANSASSPYLVGLKDQRAAMNEVRGASTALNQEILQLRRSWQEGKIDGAALADGMTTLGSRAEAALAPFQAQKEAILALGVPTKEQGAELNRLTAQMNGWSMASQRAAAGVDAAMGRITKGSLADGVRLGVNDLSVALKGMTAQTDLLINQQKAGIITTGELNTALKLEADAQLTALKAIEAKIGGYKALDTLDTQQVEHLAQLTTAQNEYTAALARTVGAQERSAGLGAKGAFMGGAGLKAGMNDAGMALSFISPQAGMIGMAASMGPVVAGAAAVGMALGGIVKLTKDGQDEAKRLQQAYLSMEVNGVKDIGAVNAALDKMSAAGSSSDKMFSKAELAEGLALLSRNGFKGAEGVTALATATRLAASENIPLQKAVTELGSNLQHLDMTATEASTFGDKLARASHLSSASMDKFSTGMNVVGFTAKSLGFSVDETMGFLAALAKKGLDPATIGATGLRNAMILIEHPSTKAKEIFAAFGIPLQDMAGHARKGRDIFTDLMNTVSSTGPIYNQVTGQLMSDTDKTNAVFQIFGTRSATAFQGVSDSAREMVRKIAESNGFLTESSDKMTSGLEGDQKRMKVAFENLSIIFAKTFTPLMTTLAEAAASALTSLNKVFNLFSDAKTPQELRMNLKISASDDLTTKILKFFGGAFAETKQIIATASDQGGAGVTTQKALSGVAVGPLLLGEQRLNTGPYGGPAIGPLLPGQQRSSTPYGSGSAANDLGLNFIEGLVSSGKVSGNPKIKAWCADVAWQIQHELGNNLKYSASAGELRKNALAAGYTEVSAKDARSGDLAFYKGAGYGANGSGNHVENVAGWKDGILKLIGASGSTTPRELSAYDLAHATFLRAPTGAGAVPSADRVAASTPPNLSGKNGAVLAEGQKLYDALLKARADYLVAKTAGDTKLAATDQALVATLEGQVKAFRKAHAADWKAITETSKEAAKAEAQAAKEAGLSMAAWLPQRTQAMHLARLESQMNDGKLSESATIAAGTQIEAYRSIHEKVLAFAEDRVAKEQKAREASAKGDEEALKEQERVSSALAAGRVQDAQSAIEKLKAIQQKNLMNVTDDAQAQLAVVKKSSQDIFNAEMGLAYLEHKNSVDDANAEKNPVLKAQKLAAAETALQLASTQATTDRLQAMKDANDKVQAEQDKADKEAEQRQKQADQAAAQIADAARQGNITRAQQGLDKLNQLREKDLTDAGDNLKKKVQIEQDYGDRIYNSEMAVAAAQKKADDAKANNGPAQLRKQALEISQQAYDAAQRKADAERSSRADAADKAYQAQVDKNNAELEQLNLDSLNRQLTALKNYHSDALAGIKDNLTARAALIKQFADAEHTQELLIAGAERDKAMKALDPSSPNYQASVRAIGATYQEAQDAADRTRNQANIQAQDAVTQSVRTSRDAYSKLADTLREKILLGKVDQQTLTDADKAMTDLQASTDKAGISTNSYILSAKGAVAALQQQAIDSATLTGAFNDVQDGGRRVVATQQEINDSIQRAIDLIPENQDQWAAYTTLLDNMEKAGTAAAGTLKHVTDEMLRLKGLLIGDESNSFIGDPSTNTIGEGGDFSAVQDGAKGIDGKIKPFVSQADRMSQLIADIPNGLKGLDDYQAGLEQMATNGQITTKQLEALKAAIQGVRDAAGPFKPLKGDNLEGRGLAESLTQDATKDGALGAVSQEDQQHLQEAIAAATSEVLTDAITHLGKAGKDSPLYKMLSAELASRNDTQLIGDVGENPSDYADGARLINGTLGSKPLDSPQPNTLDFAGIMDGIKKNRLTSDQVMGLISGPDSGGLSKDEVEQVKAYLINTHQDVLDKTRAQDMAAFAIKKQLNQLSEKEIITQQEAFDVAAAESTFVHATAGLEKTNQLYIDAQTTRDNAVTAIHNKATADQALLDQANTRALDALQLQQARTALDLLHQTLGISERQFITERAQQDADAENAAFKILQDDHKDTEAATKAHTAKLIEIEAQKNATLAGLDDKTSRARGDLGLSKMSADLESQHTADLNGRKLISDRQYIEAKLYNAQVAATVQYSRDMADQMDSQLAYEKWQAALTAAERTAVTDRIALSKAEFAAYQTGLASIGTAFSGILSTLGLDGFAKINTALFSMVDTIEKVPKSLNEVKASAKNFSADKSLGNLGGLLSSVGGVVGLAGAAISAIGQIGDAIASLDPKFAAWKKHLTDIANLEKTAAGSLKVGNFANSFYNQLQDDATNHEKLANAGFWQRLGWSLFGGAPKALDDAKSAALQKSGEVFQNFASDISNTLESTMLAAFDSGDWSNVEQAMSKSLNNLVAKMAIQTVIASSKLGPLMNKLAKDVGDKAPQSVINADLKNIREAENTVLATGQKITSMLDGYGQDAPAVGSVNAANDRVQRMQTTYDKATTPSERAYYAEQLRQAKADQASITPSTGAAGNAPGLSVTASPQLVDALNANTKAMNDQLSARRGGVVGAQQPLLDQTGASGIAAQAISNSAATFNFDAIASLSQSIQMNLPIFDLATRRFDDGVTRQLSGFESLLGRYLGTPGAAPRPNVPGY